MKKNILLLIFLANILFAFYNNDTSQISLLNEINYTIYSGSKLTSKLISKDNLANKLFYTSLITSSFIFDKSIYKRNLKNNYPEIEKPLNVIKNCGEIKLIAPISLSIYAFGYYFQNNQLYEIGRDLTNSLFFTGITITTLKTITGRSRPYVNEGPSKYRFFQTKFDYTSLPSGHTAIAFTLATVFSKHLNNTYATIFLYSLAAGTSLERIYSNNHWFSDVIMAGIISYNIADVITDKKNNLDKSFIIYPDYHKQGIGILVRF